MMGPVEVHEKVEGRPGTDTTWAGAAGAGFCAADVTVAAAGDACVGGLRHDPNHTPKTPATTTFPTRNIRGCASTGFFFMIFPIAPACFKRGLMVSQ